MDPALGYTVLKTTTAVASGLAGRSQAMSEHARAESEARLAETQALQRDTIARDDLNSFLSSMRAARAANGLSSTSPNAMVLAGAAIRQSDKDRIRARSDDRQKAANFRSSANSYQSAGRWSLASGLVRGGVPIAQYGINQG